MSKQDISIVFDYRALRLMVGLIALTLPFIVSTLAQDQSLESISGSYHTEARNAFVGLLFVVGAFLWAYNGHTAMQKTLSKVAAVATIGVAVFPTACNICESTLTSKMHYGSATVLFVVLAIFCFVFFRIDIKGQSGKKGLRSKIYLVCGWVMVVSMLAMAAKQIPSIKMMFGDFPLVFWAESAALCAFGVAWIVAGKYLSILTEPEETLKLFPTNTDE